MAKKRRKAAKRSGGGKKKSRNFILLIIAGLVVTFVLQWAFHEKIFMEVFKATKSLWKNPDPMMGHAHMLLSVVLFVAFYHFVRGVFEKGPKGAVMLGLLSSAVFYVPMALAMFLYFRGFNEALMWSFIVVKTVVVTANFLVYDLVESRF